MKRSTIIFLVSTILLLPLFVLAQSKGPAEPRNFKDSICIVMFLALDFIPYILVIAFGNFIIGLIKYVGNGDNEEKRSEGRKMMIYGILGFFFMVSLWGILRIFTNSFNLPLGIPQFADGQTPSQRECRRTDGK